MEGSCSRWAGKEVSAGREARVILGAGGASRAVVYGLSRKKARAVTVVDMFPEKAEKIARDLGRVFRGTAYEALRSGDLRIRELIGKADLVVNATPLGLKKTDPMAVPSEWIPKADAGPKLFMDLIYNPAETRFLALARKRGHRTLNGLGMLFYQGVRAFECWTGGKAPVSVMRNALLEGAQDKRQAMIEMFYPVIIFVFGAIAGSFLNVCIHRMPRELSIVWPGSFCPKCKIPIPWYENIPLLSYLILRGKCFRCRRPISFRYFFVELLNAVSWLLIWRSCGLSAAFAIAAVFVSMMIVVTLTDLEADSSLMASRGRG